MTRAYSSIIKTTCVIIFSRIFFYVLVILFCPLATDWQFASTHEGQRVPFATAGDCFSAARCPQVRTTTREGISVHQHCSNPFSGQHSLHSMIEFSFKTEPCQSSLNVAATNTHSSCSSSWKGKPPMWLVMIISKDTGEHTHKTRTSLFFFAHTVAFECVLCLCCCFIYRPCAHA